MNDSKNLCRSCGAKIKWIQLESGKWNPVDPDAIHFNECDEAKTLIMEDGTVYKVNPDNRYPQAVTRPATVRPTCRVGESGTTFSDP